MAGVRPAALCLIAACFTAAIAGAQDEPVTDDAAVTVRYSLKSSALLSRWPDDPTLFPDRGTATGFWRLRVEPQIRWRERLTFDVAFEQRWRAFTGASAVFVPGVLTPEGGAPFRVRQLDWRLASARNIEWRGEVDRAALHLHLPRADFTIGRQAIGWGRGALFGAVDLFAPFTPLEADREWRRGVDAVRGDVKLGKHASFDTVAAFGRTARQSSVAARVRGYAGKADLEVLGGYRVRDIFAGATSSAALGDLELHGELAVYGTNRVFAPLEGGRTQSIVKAVAGGSYRVPLRNGMLTYVEYVYSGFGARSPDEILLHLSDPEFQERYLRGDMQILGRHAVGVLAAYEWSPEVSLAAQWVHSPLDGSGVAVPSVTYTINDRWSVLLNGYVPYGRAPAGAVLRSDFGASPAGLFAQIRLYR
jgi:hypothetical protein